MAEVTAEEARQLYQVRSALEGLAGRLFAENATDAQRRAMAPPLRAGGRAATAAGGGGARALPGAPA